MTPPLLLLSMFLLWDGASAAMPPSDGECTFVFKEVHPPKIMTVWYVILHTDNLMPQKPPCLIVKFGRRDSFLADFRVEIFVIKRDNETYSEVQVPVVFGDVTSDVGTYFNISIPGASGSPFPPNMMVTRHAEDKGCLAIWTCQDLNGSTQKAAWIMCDSTEPDSALIDEMEQDLSEKAAIDRSHFVLTQYETCVM